MYKISQQVSPLKLAGFAFALMMVGSSAVFALPSPPNAHAQTNDSPAAHQSNVPATAPTGSTHSQVATQTNGGQANGQSHLAAAQLKSCQNRENAINTIMSRIKTRAQNQTTLFDTIAARVENFYASKGKTLSNYNQLVAAISTAKAQTQTDFSTLQTTTFSCTANDPKGMVTAFQGYLKTEITDLQNYRTAVKNLIVGVASVNGVTVSSSNSQSNSTQGGQQQ